MISLRKRHETEVIKRSIKRSSLELTKFSFFILTETYALVGYKGLECGERPWWITQSRYDIHKMDANHYNGDNIPVQITVDIPKYIYCD